MVEQFLRWLRSPVVFFCFVFFILWPRLGKKKSSRSSPHCHVFSYIHVECVKFSSSCIRNPALLYSMIDYVCFCSRGSDSASCQHRRSALPLQHQPHRPQKKRKRKMLTPSSRHAIQPSSRRLRSARYRRTRKKKKKKLG